MMDFSIKNVVGNTSITADRNDFEEKYGDYIQEVKANWNTALRDIKENYLTESAIAEAYDITINSARVLAKKAMNVVENEMALVWDNFMAELKKIAKPKQVEVTLSDNDTFMAELEARVQEAFNEIIDSAMAFIRGEAEAGK